MLKYRKEFHDMFTEFSEHSEFGPLMNKMQVIDVRGHSKMDEEQWEAASKSGVAYHTCLTDAAPRYLHWVHFRKTVAIICCVLFISLCVLSLLSSASPFVYLYYSSHYRTPASFVGGL